MNALRAIDAPGPTAQLQRVARFPKLRALAWQRNVLYAGSGYELLRTTISATEIPSDRTMWERVGFFRPSRWRRWTARMSLAARLVRDGFHALATLPSGALVAAVPGAIVTLRPGESEFRVTHTISRGTRPLHITATPTGTLYWGEYFDNASRDEVHIYASHDQGATWDAAYTFPRGAIRHVHNIVYDRWEDCLWVLTGDTADECRILRASCDFRQVDISLRGNQQTRAVALVPTDRGLYFSSDTPLEDNHIYLLDRQGKLSTLTSISSSSIYGCRVGSSIFFSTMIEPSAHNTDRHVRVYAGDARENWQPLLSWRKDRWPMGLFQYGNAFLPDGENATPYLAVSTIAVRPDDMVTSLYAVAQLARHS